MAAESAIVLNSGKKHGEYLRASKVWEPCIHTSAVAAAQQ